MGRIIIARKKETRFLGLIMPQRLLDRALLQATLEGYREGSLLAQAAGSTSWNACIAFQDDMSQRGSYIPLRSLYSRHLSFCLRPAPSGYLPLPFQQIRAMDRRIPFSRLAGF
jgi:hypothetical protein